ncbi:thiol-disulfide oxidoreductase DCC family protein [Nocardioides acrostichi]|uniref:DUF393 domain-containing protein n=1 Tax=Nocardioides acrostichi TaxID=2784339 RepID=A0A930V4H3_9ACTN|nr:DCC1-like thiol-disulfide oxidoreductase family protein [Nocardioides acrostichi]MBF4163681.1 DUF393 domain-containing protein [Nocardioides acrostichi]
MGTIVYDADCGFCTVCAQWLARHGACTVQPWQALDLAAAGLTEAEASEAVRWLDDAGRATASGAEAISLALRTCGIAYRLPGWLIWLAPVRPLARVVYRVVARHRHRLPGGTAACRLDAPR